MTARIITTIFCSSPALDLLMMWTGSRKTVIRAGAGLFYADIQVNQAIEDQIFNGQTTLAPAVQPTAARLLRMPARSSFFCSTGPEVC